MGKVILVTGGVRSGKSERAEALTRTFSGRPIYVATTEFIDGEMKARIATHRQRRGADWDMLEAPIDLSDALLGSDGQGARLVDCLTIWISNLMYHGRDWKHALEVLCQTLQHQSSPVILVSSEVGLGMLPDNALGREFCDALGMVNQKIAAQAQSVEFVVSGLPLKLK